ncbi:MAG: GntR family transcriptional regulator [Pseudomonadales bacterium]|nr:GntR family transcriptional regulator [Pseudomonadales bacterium]
MKNDSKTSTGQATNNLLRPNNLSRVELITATLRDEILRGQYRTGERLPSERDLAAKFETNRGAIREALKKLEQLGIASINPGGVRVVPIEEASLSILGPLIDLDDKPDAILIGHMLDVVGTLISMLARTAIDRASDQEIEEMLTIVQRMIGIETTTLTNQQNWQALGSYFAQINNNLVLRLILNGLKAQFLQRHAKTDAPDIKLDQQKNLAILKKLESSLQQRDSVAAATVIIDHFLMVKKAVQSALEVENVNHN